MATCQFLLATGGAIGSIGVWFKFPNNPSSNTAIHEVYQSGSGYMRFYLSTTGTVQFEWNGFSSASATLTGALTPGVWYFVRCWTHYDGDNRSRISADCYQVNGTSQGGYTSGALFTGAPAITWPTAVYCLGQFLSSTGVTHWPNTSGWELGKPICNGAYAAGSNGPIPLPNADWGSASQPMTVSSGKGGYWNMRGVSGSVSTIPDDSGNGFDLSGTFTVVTDGPYAT